MDSAIMKTADEQNPLFFWKPGFEILFLIWSLAKCGSIGDMNVYMSEGGESST